MGKAIKLLASSKKTEKGYMAMVAPFLLPATHPLYNVNGVFNAVFVKGNALGDAMFYGSGAGKLPTASAVVADVVEIAKNLDCNLPVEWKAEKIQLVDYTEAVNQFFVRTTENEAAVEKVFGKVNFVKAENVSGEIGFVTEAMTEAAFAGKVVELSEVLQTIRMA